MKSEERMSEARIEQERMKSEERMNSEISILEADYDEEKLYLQAEIETLKATMSKKLD